MGARRISLKAAQILGRRIPHDNNFAAAVTGHCRASPADSQETTSPPAVRAAGDGWIRNRVAPQTSQAPQLQPKHMSNDATRQEGEKTLKTLSLSPEALNEEVLRCVGDGKIGWTASDHERLSMSVVQRLMDPERKAPALQQTQLDTLTLVFRHAIDTQTKEVARVFADAGYKLDKSAKNALAVLFVPATFAEKLSKKTNPKTGKSFITKEPRTKRSKGFEDFIDAE